MTALEYQAGPEPVWEMPAIGSRQGPEASFAPLDWRGLLAQPDDPPPMLGSDIPVPKVGVTVLAAPPKIGKTVLACQWALMVDHASLFVEEGSLSGLSYRLRRQAAALDIAAPDLEVIHRSGLRLDEKVTVQRLRRYVERRRPRLVVVDPLNRAHRADENRPTQMTPVMDALAGLAYDSDCAVLAIHHLAKPSAERRGDVWDRFRGATSIRSGTDANLALDGSGELLKLVGEYRDAEPLSTYLRLDRDTLTFSLIEGPRLAGKIDGDALRTFVADRRQVTVREVADEFTCAKNTAKAALEADGFDAYDGPNRTRYYTLIGAQ